ncbi:uncharacterized protein LOC124149403 isoform X1 [Haliotis rufescens]|uniref:uncharacterized protein LOC124149403 isoform X1 n=2 Tax=Haliotis rufescens TaxID=6454 RepID=UPI001EAFFD61|nr:uncharacterized protein LOC124149403 isoform X1 [Haliotis rufescens]
MKMRKSSSFGTLLKTPEETEITFPSFVPVVSLEYTSPGAPFSRQVHSCSPTQMSSRARRISRHVNRYGRPKERGIEDEADCTHKIQGIGLPRPQMLRKFTFLSSSTPTVPFSTADLLYNPEASRPAPPAEDFSTTDLVYFDRDKDKLKLRDIDANRRPSSRNNSRRSISLEKVNFEGEKDELRPIKNTFPTAKGQNHGRTNGVRGTLLRSDQLLNHKNNVQGRESDDLVAMGTIWSPNLQQRNSTTTSTTTSKSFSLTSTSNTSNVNLRKGPSAPTTRVGFPNNFSTSRSTAKDSEPKYTDPVSGASPSFQQRLMELSALEAETVRWERTKKIKKKAKQDRDS